MGQSELQIRSFAGIDNVNDPGRHVNDWEQAKVFLTEAINVDIDDTSMISRAEGYYLSQPGAYRSFWSTRDKTFGLCMEGGTLNKIVWNGSTIIITPLSTGFDPTAKMSYVETDERIFMTNGYFVGYLENNIIYPLSDPNQTFKTKTPAGHLIEFYANQLYVAVDRIIFYSDALAWGRTDLRKNFIPFTSRILMMQAVDDGLFVSDEENIYFLPGKTAKEMALVNKLSQPIFPGGYQKVDGSIVGPESSISGDVIFMLTEEGIYLGGSGGSFSNLTKDRYNPPLMNEISSLVRIDPDTHQIIFIGSVCAVSMLAELELELPSLNINILGH